ncbi:hypothetical protein ACJX0J_010478, partial [Zea mays]
YGQHTTKRFSNSLILKCYLFVSINGKEEQGNEQVRKVNLELNHSIRWLTHLDRSMRLTNNDLEQRHIMNDMLVNFGLICVLWICVDEVFIGLKASTSVHVTLNKTLYLLNCEYGN